MISRCYFELGKSFNVEEWFRGALQNSWRLTAVVLCPLSMESVSAMPGLVDTVQCFSRAVKHVVIQAFVSLSLSVSDTEILPPPLGFAG